MKVYIGGYEPNRIGGGWSFSDAIAKGLGDTFTTHLNEADIFLIPGATMVERNQIPDDKKVVLRVDNALLDSRNRGTGMPRMFEYAERADAIVYQSEWCKEYLKPYLKKDGHVILNGCDLDTYKPGENHGKEYLYVRSSRAENKGWEMVRYYFSKLALQYPRIHLNIVGKFADDTKQNNFDFFGDENWTYWGELPHQYMADLYRKCGEFFYPYFNDCCSNTLIEALCSGCELFDLYGMSKTGGAKEILDKFDSEGREYFGIERMTNSYLEVFNE